MIEKSKSHPLLVSSINDEDFDVDELDRRPTMAFKLLELVVEYFHVLVHELFSDQSINDRNKKGPSFNKNYNALTKFLIKKKITMVTPKRLKMKANDTAAPLVTNITLFASNIAALAGYFYNDTTIIKDLNQRYKRATERAETVLQLIGDYRNNIFK